MTIKCDDRTCRYNKSYLCTANNVTIEDHKCATYIYNRYWLVDEKEADKE